jgi:DNA polymerase-3 subunit beta
MIGKVSHSVAEQDNRPMLCGAFLKINKAGLEVVSSDSFTLSLCKYKCDVETLNENGEYSFIIPGHALSEISKVLLEGDGDEVKFYIARRHAILVKDDIIFFTRTIDSEYIDYNRVIPKENDIEVIIERERLLAGLERVNIIAEEKIQGRGRSYVKLSVYDHLLELTSVSVNGKVTDEIDCFHVGGDIEIGFNCRFLINSIKAAEGDNVKITMRTPTQAITVENASKEDDDFSYLYMILPVRMNEKQEL